MIKNKTILKEGCLVFDTWEESFGIVEEVIDAHNVSIINFNGNDCNELGHVGEGDYKGSELACLDKNCESYRGTIFLTSGLN